MCLQIACVKESDRLRTSHARPHLQGLDRGTDRHTVMSAAGGPGRNPAEEFTDGGCADRARRGGGKEAKKEQASEP
jgi:hypothetical protein